MPKISREIQSATRAAGNKAAKEALAELKQQNPEVGQSARLGLDRAAGSSAADNNHLNRPHNSKIRNKAKRIPEKRYWTT